MTEPEDEQREKAWEAMMELKRRIDNPEPQLMAAAGWCSPSSTPFVFNLQGA